MDTIFMNSKNSKTSEPHRVDTIINLNRSDNMLFYQILTCAIHRKIKKKKSQKNKFKVSTPTWHKNLELPGRSYVSNIRDYFEYNIKEHEKVTDNLPIRIYANKLENRIKFKIKIKYYLNF